MQKKKFKVTPLERAWILYDVGNSAFVLMIATLVPIFFNALAEAGGVSKDVYKRQFHLSEQCVNGRTVAAPLLGIGGKLLPPGRGDLVIAAVAAVDRGVVHCQQLSLIQI